MASVDERLEMLVGESDSDSDSLSSFSSNETDYDDELIYNDQYEDTINQYYTERDGNAQDGVPQQIGLFTVNTDKKSYICYDATDKFLIDCAKKEYKAVVRMVEIATQKDVNDERACPYELFKVFFPHTMITSMIKWIDEYSPSAKKIRVTCSDIKALRKYISCIVCGCIRQHNYKSCVDSNVRQQFTRYVHNRTGRDVPARRT